MNIAESLHDTAVSELDLQRHVTVESHMSASQTIDRMNEAEVSCALVVEAGELVGIFTQRDVVTRVLGVDGACEKPVSEVMTPSPRTVGSDASITDALAVMTEMWVRSVPVVDDGVIIGNFSYYAAMKVIAELLTAKASRTESDLSAQHGLMFVDLTGLNSVPPVTVRVDDSLAAAVHQMNARAIGSVLAVNAREALVGVLTEFDLQTKVACTGKNLDEVTVEEVMKPDPGALPVRSPIGDAVAWMADHEMSHVALLGETGRPVGTVTFREVADYFESSLLTLG